jgi:hypothetical protein
MLIFRNFLTYYLSIEFITLVRNKIEIKTIQEMCKSVSEKLLNW